LILIAAFAGQLNRWRKQWKSHVHMMPVAEKKRASTAEEIALAEGHPGRAEGLVKFKSGVSSETIEEITNRLHDRVEDRIESDPGLEAIDDLDNDDPATVATVYSSLPEVEYAEPNYEISLDATESYAVVRPTDPRFEDQWALANSGQRGGKEGADISAMKAWGTTTGSDRVVVAVLDSGVD